MPDLELWVHDSITGNEIKQVHPTEDCSWSTNLGGTGESSWTFRIDSAELGIVPDSGIDRTDPHLKGSEVDALFIPNARMLGLRFGTVALGAWKIEDWDYDEDGQSVTVTAVEIRNEAKWRLTYGVNVYLQGTLAVVNRSHAGAVRAILARFMQWSAEWKYPIDLPADGAGSFSATWEYWKKFTIADLLKQIEDEGYEILLRPYLTAGMQLRFQTLVAPKVTVGTKHFHLQAEDRPMSGIRYRKSGAEQLTGGQGIGTGSGEDQPVTWAGGAPYVIPIRDAKRDFPDLDGARLQQATNAWVGEARTPTVQWSIGKFTWTDEYPPNLAMTGQGWTLESSGHPIFPNGRHEVRVIGASGTFGREISTEVQSGS